MLLLVTDPHSSAGQALLANARTERVVSQITVMDQKVISDFVFSSGGRVARVPNID
jgi:hypothetical protein